MDPEKAKRRQSLKIIASEFLMVLTVIITVIILGFLVSGYWINSDFKVERQGLLQISSLPTGASVYIDGDSSWLQRTNTSKVLSSGEHTINLTKNGYDSWSKTINISEGLLYRLHYPRLFLQDRTAENILDSTDAALATISPDHNSLLFITNTPKWTLVNLNSTQPQSTILDVSQIFTDTDFANTTIDLDWDADSNHILFHTKSPAASEWILFNINNIQDSVNLTKEFGSNFSEIQILDNSSNNLLAVQNGNLHKIDVSGKVLSSVLVENIANFNHFNRSEIIFSAQNPTTNEPNYYIGLLRLNDNKITKLTSTTTPAKVTLSKFYEDKYISILENNTLSLYQRENFTLINSFNLSFAPTTIKVGHDGEFIIMSLGNQIATLDMEIMSTTEWQTSTSNYGWIDNDMIYDISDGNLIIYDFDGLNQRTIANNVSSYFPATITDNKWLYYFSNNSLVREIIAD